MVKVHINNTPQLQTYICLHQTAHPHTTKQLTRTYNTAYSTSQTYHTQSSPEMWTHTPLSGTRTLMITKDNHSRCYQQFGTHNTKYRPTNQSAKHHTATIIITRYHHIVDYSTRTIIRPRNHHHHNQHTTWLQTTTKLTNYYKLQESRLDTIYQRHRVRFHSDHNTHQHTHYKHNFPDGR